MPADTSRRFSLPVTLTRQPRKEWDYFHATNRPKHAGIDLYCLLDADVVSSHPGAAKVHRAGFLNTVAGFGVELVEQQPSGVYATRYLHAPSNGVVVTAGQVVTPRQKVMRADTSGQGTNSCHVHFEIRWSSTLPQPGRDLAGWGTPLDPLAFGILDDTDEQITLSRVAVDRPLLRYGDNRSPLAVRELQVLLSFRGYFTGEIDGVFGAKTRAAVKAFQTAKGLVADGIVGSNTWTALLDY